MKTDELELKTKLVLYQRDYDHMEHYHQELLKQLEEDIDQGLQVSLIMRWVKPTISSEHVLLQRIENTLTLLAHQRDNP